MDSKPPPDLVNPCSKLTEQSDRTDDADVSILAPLPVGLRSHPEGGFLEHPRQQHRQQSHHQQNQIAI